jgi:hypothetical protein
VNRGALSGIVVLAHGVPPVLLMLNVGVELGQTIIVSGVLSVLDLVRRIKPPSIQRLGLSSWRNR